MLRKIATNRRQFWDYIMGNMAAFIAIASTALFLAIILFMWGESRPIWVLQGFNFVGGTEWNPVGHPPQLGIASMIAGTLWVALGAMVLAAPIGFGCAIFLAEFAPVWLARILRPILNILTGIPSVVYGFLGAAVLVKFFEKTFNQASGESLFCASLVLTIMILPFIVANSESALRAIPREYRQSALALGVSHQYLTIKVLVPLAKKGMFGSLVLAFGRAAGETMAVLMVAGNNLLMPTAWFDKGEPIPALIALEVGSAEVGSPHYQALFASGLVLIIFIAAINLFTNLLMQSTRNGGSWR
ncbi:MAG: phosphate ABC transporter permease subunit PstC [Syntrophomonas sp.]|nr:phosphate ABC transporter permease subunit PstC [Syntrophomonas sp.]